MHTNLAYTSNKELKEVIKYIRQSNKLMFGFDYDTFMVLSKEGTEPVDVYGPTEYKHKMINKINIFQLCANASRYNNCVFDRDFAVGLNLNLAAKIIANLKNGSIVTLCGSDLRKVSLLSVCDDRLHLFKAISNDQLNIFLMRVQISTTK